MTDGPTYIVHIAIDRDRHDEWLEWMQAVHVPDVVATGCFVGAQIVARPERDTPSRLAYDISYDAASSEAFDRYGTEFAPALQAEHTARFAGAFEASRTVTPAQ